MYSCLSVGKDGVVSDVTSCSCFVCRRGIIVVLKLPGLVYRPKWVISMIDEGCVLKHRTVTWGIRCLGPHVLPSQRGLLCDQSMCKSFSETINQY